MLVFNEGLPRSGKSYDCVKNHILPALQAGRTVYARINGLQHEAIAQHLLMDIAKVRELLVIVSTAEVKTLFIARRDLQSADQEWYIADELKNALFVVDEAHEFYVASREAINPAIEQFFALCGQNGMDGVLMSQWYRRLHSSVRARIERKNVFQKMTAVGMQGKFTLKQYHATEPDRFELVDTTVGTYDPKIFPLYSGYAPGATNTAVYTAGGVTVWRKLGKYALVMVPLVGVGVYCLVHFLSGGAPMVKQGSSTRIGPAVTTTHAPAASPALDHSAVSAAVSSPATHHAEFNTKGMPPEVAYVFDMTSQARPRLAALAKTDAGDWGVVEWRQDQGQVLERMTLVQLRDLGVVVQVHAYGLKLVWAKQSIIVTPWPLDTPPIDQQGDQQQLVQAPAQAPAGPSGQPEQGQAGTWKGRATAATYTPPELMPREERSTYTIH